MNSIPRNIFLVDDDRDTVQFYCTFFPLYGYNIAAVAYSGDEAVTIYHSLATKPDIIFLDHRMPGKNGLEVAMEILSHDPEARIIMASADVNAREEALRIGVRDFKEKPVDIQQILTCIKTLF